MRFGFIEPQADRKTKAFDAVQVQCNLLLKIKILDENQ